MDVKRLREQMGLTQIQLADRVGVTLRTIQNWEGGRPLPKRVQRLLLLLADQQENGQMGNAAQADKDGIVSEGNVDVQGSRGRRPVFAADMQCFFDALERQQELLSRQLDELVLTRQLIEKKDEQIDMLLKLIQSK